MLGLLKNLFSEIVPESEINEGNRNATLSVSLLQDISGSMAGLKDEQAKKASCNTLDSLNKGVEVGVIAFGQKARLISGLSYNFEKIKSQVRALSVGGLTPLMGSLELSKEYHISKSKTKSVIVITTDGMPTDAPNEEIIELAEQIKSQGSKIITIGIGEEVQDEFLKKLASSPEDYHFAEAPDQIGRQFEKVVGTLRTLSS